MFPKPVISLIVLILLSVTQCVLAQAKVAPPDPAERVQRGVELVLSIVQDKTLSQDQRYEKVRAIVEQHFDFRSMSQSVLATNWKKASPEERRRFVDFFSEYIENIYFGAIEAYTGEEIEYGEGRIRGKRALVDTFIVTKTARIPVTYKLKLNDGEWYAYDVIIEGVSLVNNYRRTFSAIIRNDGVDGLLNDIQQRIDKYKATQRAKGEG
jgi:phospholipid transport system substrate-binding protein